MRKKLFLIAILIAAVNTLSSQEKTLQVLQNSLSATLSSNEFSKQNIQLKNPGKQAMMIDIRAFETTRGSVPEISQSIYKNDDKADFRYFFKQLAAQNLTGVSWIKLNTEKKLLLPGESFSLQLHLDATGLQPGIYSAYLVISGHNPDFAEKFVPVNLIVSNADPAPCYGFTGEDNENNMHTGIPDNDMDVYLGRFDEEEPIEFNIFIDDPGPVNSAQLSIYAWDIDETSGEIDEVYFNGHLIGTLTGANMLWSTTVLDVPVEYVNTGPAGKNLVSIEVDLIEATWKVNVDWGQLIINDCDWSNAYFRYVRLDEPCYLPGEQVQVEFEVDTDLSSQDIIVETNLLNPEMVNIAGNIKGPYTISLQEDEPGQALFYIPYDAVQGPSFYIQSIIYDAATYQQQEIKITPVIIQGECEFTMVPLSDWAVYSGILLIIVSLLVRYRRSA